MGETSLPSLPRTCTRPHSMGPNITYYTTGIAMALTGPVCFEALSWTVLNDRVYRHHSLACHSRPAAPLVVEDPPPTTRWCSWVTPTFSGLDRLAGNPRQLRRSECLTLPAQRVVSRRNSRTRAYHVHGPPGPALG